MASRPQTLAKTTGMGNNCSFHCLTHFIAKELLDPRKSETDLSRVYQQPVYQALLRAVASYYNLPAVTPTMFQNMLRNFQNPIDREIFLGPVLRQQFKELLKEPRIMRPQLASFTSEFTQDVAKYIKKQNLELEIKTTSEPVRKAALQKQMAAINYSNEYFIEANKDWLKTFYNDYQTTKAMYAKSGQGDINVEAYVSTMLDPEKIETAYQRFADHIGNQSKQTYVDDHQLQLFAAEFGIKNLRVQMPEFDGPIDYFERYDPRGKDLTVKIINRNHWEYLDDAALADMHNRAYQNYNVIKDKLEAFIDPEARDYGKKIAARDQEIRILARAQNLKLVDFMITGDRAAINAQIKAELERSAHLAPKGPAPAPMVFAAQQMQKSATTRAPTDTGKPAPEKPKVPKRPW